MKPELAYEVAKNLNIEAGHPCLYRVAGERSKGGGCWVERGGRDGATRVHVDGYEGRLVVACRGHPRGYRFQERPRAPSATERFDWQAVHLRCTQLVRELGVTGECPACGYPVEGHPRWCDSCEEKRSDAEACEPRLPLFIPARTPEQRLTRARALLVRLCVDEHVATDTDPAECAHERGHCVTYGEIMELLTLPPEGG